MDPVVRDILIICLLAACVVPVLARLNASSIRSWWPSYLIIQPILWGLVRDDVVDRRIAIMILVGLVLLAATLRQVGNSERQRAS